MVQVGGVSPKPRDARSSMSIPDYTLIRSSRRSLTIQIDREWSLIVRAPQRMSVSVIEDFIMRKREWIEKHQKRIHSTQHTVHGKKYTEIEIREMKERLKNYITPRVRELWMWKNLPPYTSIKITKSERRWWSCSGKNGLCFSYRLAEYLEKDIDIVHRKDVFLETNTQNTSLWLCTMTMHSSFIDAIIVHELAHLREKNHQKPFWDLVYSMMPEYEDIIWRQNMERKFH